MKLTFYQWINVYTYSEEMGKIFSKPSQHFRDKILKILKEYENNA